MDIGQVTWRKSSYTGNSGGNCVEVAHTPGTAVAVRDSKDPDGPKLAFTPTDWRRFVQQIKHGHLSRA